jgi:hypothetical protein
MMESMDSRGHESGILKGPEPASLQAPSSLPRTSASTHSLPRNPLFVSRLPFASCTHLGRTRDRHREDQIPSVSGYSSLYSFVCWWDCVGSPSTHDCPHQFPPLPVGRRFFNICCAACAWERDDYNPVGGLITLAIIRRVSGWGLLCEGHKAIKCWWRHPREEEGHISGCCTPHRERKEGFLAVGS